MIRPRKVNKLLDMADDLLLTSDDVDALREFIYWSKEADTI